ncbi:hypothetical protein [Lysobacter gummosus]
MVMGMRVPSWANRVRRCAQPSGKTTAPVGAVVGSLCGRGRPDR